MNLCRSCGQDFGSIRAFDAHRVGRNEYTYNEEHTDGRRCLSLEEMQAAAFVSNGRGRWSLAGHLQAARNVRDAKASCENGHLRLGRISARPRHGHQPAARRT